MMTDGLRRKSGEANEDDARGQAPQSVDELSEVLIAGEQHPLIAAGDREDFVIADPGRQLCDVHDVVTVGSEP